MTIPSEISLLVFLAVSLVSAQTETLKIDHVPICVAELAPVQEAFASVGLTPDYGGPHVGAGTHMALLGFDDGSYFELLAPQKPGSAEKSPEAKLLAGSAGPCMWAVSTSDIKAELKRLHDLGIATDGPFPGGRTRPDGQVLKWETAGIGPGSRGDVLPFLIQDYTAHNLRVQPSASVHGSALSGIAIVVVGVKDLTPPLRSFARHMVEGAGHRRAQRHECEAGIFCGDTGRTGDTDGRRRMARPKAGEIRRRPGCGFDRYDRLEGDREVLSCVWRDGLVREESRLV